MFQIIAKAISNDIKDALIDFVILFNIGFTIVENIEFYDLFRLLNPSVTAVILPDSTITIGKQLEDCFNKKKFRIRNEFIETLQRIYFSFDLWILLNRYTIFTVVAYYVDVFGALRIRLIVIPYVKGYYSSENISQSD